MTQLRDSEGRYRHEFERLCVCGHTNGEHTAERVKVNGVWQQPCVTEYGVGPEGPCPCECFKLSRKKA